MTSFVALVQRFFQFRQMRSSLSLLALVWLLAVVWAGGQEASNSAPTSLRGGSGSRVDAAPDGKGIVFIATEVNGTVVQSTAGSVDFESQEVGVLSEALALKFSIAAGTTLGRVAVLTTGLPNLDFSNAGSSTCVAQTYAAASTCVVMVRFEPLVPGLRRGGVVLYDESGNVLASVPVYGTGIGPETTFLPGKQSTVASFGSGGLLYPEGLAVDAGGSVYIADEGNGRVVKETPSVSGYVQSTIANGLTSPQGVAVDGSGNVFITDTGKGLVLMETPAADGFSESTVGNGWNYPAGIALDGSGNIYIADYFKTYLVMETPSASGYTARIIGSGMSEPTAVAVDSSGNVYIADWGHDRVVKETLSAGSYTQSIVDSDLRQPNGVAVDGGGNVYITDSDNNRELKETLQAGEYTRTVLTDEATGDLNFPTGVALDGSGNVYIADEGNDRVLKVDLADAPALSFATTAGGTTSADSSQTVTVANIGNTALAFLAVYYPEDFPKGASGDATECTSTSNLSVGGSCALTIDFSPVVVDGANTSFSVREDVLLATETLDKEINRQQISVQGKEIKLASTIVFTSSSAALDDCSLIALTATVGGSGPKPAGTVRFSSNDGELGEPVTLTNGVAALNLRLTRSSTVRAVYYGDAVYAASVSKPVQVTVTRQY
jgi:sugar lactone lactonase YvrE